jgi:hypothetical protein
MTDLVERVAALLADDCDPTDTARKAQARAVVDMVLDEAAGVSDKAARMMAGAKGKDIASSVLRITASVPREISEEIRALGGGK